MKGAAAILVVVAGVVALAAIYFSKKPGSDASAAGSGITGSTASAASQGDANTGAGLTNPTPAPDSYGAGTAGYVAAHGTGAAATAAAQIARTQGPGTPIQSNVGGNPLVTRVTDVGGGSHLVDIGGAHASASEREAARQANIADLNSRYGPGFIGS
ncbi:MAG: hypothetical protein PHV13_02950 [Candidatus ainarchaeum sp.]|nr:hypothetical protein [Candidatus ainarchaeum sp.]